MNKKHTAVLVLVLALVALLSLLWSEKVFATGESQIWYYDG